MKKGPSIPGKYSPRTDMCGTVGTAKNQHTAVAAFMAHRNPPRLPNGEINQCKNINQSVQKIKSIIRCPSRLWTTLHHFIRHYPMAKSNSCEQYQSTLQRYNGNVMNDPSRCGARNHPT
jgi:hypothetical protein